MPSPRLNTSLDLVRAFYERIWNAGDQDAVEELLATEFAFRGSLGPTMQGRAAFREYVDSVRFSLAQYCCDILDCVTEGDKCFAKMRFRGVHVAPFRGYAPTGRSVQWLGAALFKVHEQQIAELWVLGDLISLDAALGENAIA